MIKKMNEVVEKSEELVKSSGIENDNDYYYYYYYYLKILKDTNNKLPVVEVVSSKEVVLLFRNVIKDRDVYYPQRFQKKYYMKNKF